MKRGLSPIVYNSINQIHTDGCTVTHLLLYDILLSSGTVPVSQSPIYYMVIPPGFLNKGLSRLLRRSVSILVVRPNAYVLW